MIICCYGIFLMKTSCVIKRYVTLVIENENENEKRFKAVEVLSPASEISHFFCTTRNMKQILLFHFVRGKIMSNNNLNMFLVREEEEKKTKLIIQKQVAASKINYNECAYKADDVFTKNKSNNFS